MITSWYWPLLLLWAWGIAVGGKAIASRDHLEVFFSNVSLQVGVNTTISFTVTGNEKVNNLSLILLQYEGQNATTQVSNLVKVTDIETGKLHTNLGDFSIQS
jgi:hypothetical protein